MALDLKFKAKRKSGNKDWVYSKSIQEIDVFNGVLVMLKDDSNKWIEIDSNTLCIYSGKNDIDGKELYSGDIVNNGNVIEFNLFGFSLNGDKPLRNFVDLLLFGNIHDKEK